MQLKVTVLKLEQLGDKLAELTKIIAKPERIFPNGLLDRQLSFHLSLAGVLRCLTDGEAYEKNMDNRLISWSIGPGFCKKIQNQRRPVQRIKVKNEEFCLAQSEISPDLIAAYRSARYQVGSGVDAIILRLDRYSESLSHLFAARGYQCAAFITACNPFSRPQSPEANLAACTHLRDRLDRHLRRATRPTQLTEPTQAPCIVEGTGCDPSGAWPAEKSFLALGLDLEASRAIGREFGQNAIIWSGPDAIPKLILLR